jgi:general secretion pathway protein G
MRSKRLHLTRIQKAGLTLIELLLVVMLIGVLAAIAMPMYTNYRERINRSTAIMDIRVMQMLIKDYAASGGSFPASLADIGNGGKLDPINSDFDLYSMGKDGVSKTQLTQKDSLDDIVRARDGAFVGLASDFSP